MWESPFENTQIPGFVVAPKPDEAIRRHWPALGGGRFDPHGRPSQAAGVYWLGPGSSKWKSRLTSLDPSTQLPPTDPFAGFLPPNTVPPEGEGAVLFSVMPKKGAVTGAQIRNKASIVFDTNAPIQTPEWLNTVDNSLPASSVSPLSPQQSATSFPISWQGSDVGAGIGDYTVYVSDNGGPFTVWQMNTTETSATFTGAVGHTYRFYSIARDLVGNVEDPKTAAEAATTIVSTQLLPQTITFAPLAPKAYGDPPFMVAATADRALPG